MTKKRTLIILFTVMLLLASCSNADSQIETISNDITAQPAAEAATSETTAEATDEAAQTPVPVAVPDKPKYIFIVIADGYGRGAMMLGEIEARIKNEDMNAGAIWESFPNQMWVEGKGESGAGGTAIATGYNSPPSFISQNTEYEDLYTIMDRAKEAGMSTGVVSNSFILDATPATFLTHDDWRLNFKQLAERISTCDVDYIAGGGLWRLVPQSYYSSFDSLDCRHKIVTSIAPDTSGYTQLMEQGYVPYLGMQGAVDFVQQVDAGTYNEEKSICLFSQSTMAYETYKMIPTNKELVANVPSLVDLTNGGIQTLSQNPNGFVMMIEEALIDKRGHQGSQDGIAGQVQVLQATLETIMEFYNEHPDDTLVILTADHECGDLIFNEEKFEEFKTWPAFTWTDDVAEMKDFMENTWDLQFSVSSVNKYMGYAEDSPWETEEENRAKMYNYLTLQTSRKVGVELTSEYHSWQLIPCYTTGKNSEEFADIGSIDEIPITICEIMGWKALPEVMPKDK